MARGYSRSSSSKSYSKSFSSSSKGGYSKSYNNSTKQTCAQRKSPTKVGSTWYDAGGDKVGNAKAYFDKIDSNGKYWKDC